MPGPIAKKVAKKTSHRAASSDATLAEKRLARARARDDLEPPTPKDILAFQLSFLRQSNLLVYTEDPAVIVAARSVKPEPGERVAAYMDRAFGSRKVDVVFAQFKSLDGRSPMHSVLFENAGREMKGLLAMARRREKEAVEETREELTETGKKRLKRQRERARATQAADRERLSRYPAEWLEDRAREAEELNMRALNHDVHDARVVARLLDIALKARERVDIDGGGGAPLEFVVDELIAAYDGMARHERRQAERLKQLEAELSAARRAA